MEKEKDFGKLFASHNQRQATFAERWEWQLEKLQPIIRFFSDFEDRHPIMAMVIGFALLLALLPALLFFTYGIG